MGATPRSELARTLRRVAQEVVHPIVPIRRVEVYREVLDRLDQYIADNRLRSGDRLPSDRALAELLGVSRPSVRQAIKVLENFGRVEVRHGSGTYVRDEPFGLAVADLLRGLSMDRQFLHAFSGPRNAIEVQVLVEAFQHRTPANLAHVQAALEQRARGLESDDEEASLTLSFEAALGAICGNEVLHRIQRMLHQVWLQALVTLGEAPGNKHLLHREHVEIFERFCAGDLEAAVVLFRRHLDLFP